jgi:hypothetical protein
MTSASTLAALVSNRRILKAPRPAGRDLPPTATEGGLLMTDFQINHKEQPMSFRLALLSLPLFLISTLAHAQQATQQNPCFEIYRNPSAGVAGALMINKCTGETWMLIGGGPARWYPLLKEEANIPLLASLSILTRPPRRRRADFRA